MTATRCQNSKPTTDTLWIISPGRHADLNMNGIVAGVEAATVTDYRISALGDYMLRPQSIQIKKRLVGCEVHYHSSSSRWKKAISKVLPRAGQSRLNPAQLPPRTLISDLDAFQAPFKDAGLKAHFDHLYHELRPYDRLRKELAGLDLKTVSNIHGICRDMNGHDAVLKITGDVAAQLEYINTNLTQDIDVILDKAYLSKGLFEMSGFDFQKFNPDEKLRLIKFAVDGRPQAFVLGPDNKVLFNVEPIRHIYYLQILEQLLGVNPQLRESLELCRAGKARALKILFNRQVGIDYSVAPLPGIYQDVIERYKVNAKIRDKIAHAISSHQFAVMFNYLPLSDGSQGRVCSNLSLMHHLRALDTIKDADPQVYSEINSRVAINGVGKYYLLDCFRGYQE